MTDDNKKTPTDDKITELSAWQKRNKEYLEKKALEKAEETETEETESEEAKEDEDLLEKETVSVSEEESDERKSPKRKMNLGPKRILKQMEKVQKEKRMIRL